MGLIIELDQNHLSWTAKVSGDLDYGQCAAFRLFIDRILRESPPAVILDLSLVDYLDSSGLGLLLALSKEYGAIGGRLVLVINETVENILSLTRLDGIFTAATSLAEANDLVTKLAMRPNAV